MKVEWKEGRVAMVRYRFVEDGAADPGPWCEAAGIVPASGGKGWMIWTWEGDFQEEVEDEHCDTRLAPDQCPRCFEVDDHEQGCMVAANLARGVPPFWAPWAMWVLPRSGAGWALHSIGFRNQAPAFGLILLEYDYEETSWWGEGKWFGRPGEESPLRPFIAIGPGGPTLEPWEGQP